MRRSLPCKRGIPISDSGFRLMNLRRWTAVALMTVAFLAVFAIEGDAANPPTLQKIGNEVQCLCGCNAPLNECPHLECAEKAGEQAFIKAEIAAGKDETAILQDMSLKYGLQVLSTPPAHGFNLSIWILPALGLLLGLGIVFVIVRRWRQKPELAPPPASSTLDPKVLSAMEDEMKSVGLK